MPPICIGSTQSVAMCSMTHPELPCLHFIVVSYTNKQYCVVIAGMLVKPFIAVLVLYSSGVLVLWGVPYIGWAQTCMGLTMAGACTKH